MSSKLMLVSLFVLSMILMSWRSDKKKRIIFFGDSITQQGAKPGGYVSLIDSTIQAEGFGAKYETIGAGVSGNRVYDLYLRIEDDVIAKSPDIVVVYVGINDVWHKRTSGTGTEPAKYEQFYRAIIKKIQATNSKIILCTPSVIGEKNDCTNESDGDLNKYSNIVRKLAAELSLPLVDLRNQFVQYEVASNLKNVEKGLLTVDGVHMNAAGNAFLAKAIYPELKKLF